MNDITKHADVGLTLPAPTWNRSYAIRFRNNDSVVSSTTILGSRSTPLLKLMSLILLVLLFLILIPASVSSTADLMTSSPPSLIVIFSSVSDGLFVPSITVRYMSSTCKLLFGGSTLAILS